MAIRFTPDELKFLRDSPLVVKPANLPPTEQWMGPLPEGAVRKQNERPVRNNDGGAFDMGKFPDQPKRPVVERHMSRNSANPEDIVLAPPKTSFMSATSIRNPIKTTDSIERPPLRGEDSRDRFSFRSKLSEADGDRPREIRSTLRPKRADGEDSDGWSTVKPRKSFGTEGAERFNGRMGVGHREDRRFKDRDDGDVKEKPRGFGTFTRDRVEKDTDQDQDRENRRNGTGRGRNEPSWFKDRESSDQPPTPRDRNSNGDRMAERSRGWREKERDDRNDRGGDRPERGGGGADRGDRRWDRDRDQRQDRPEREPEWMEAPAEEKSKAHTQEEFEKWKEQMQGKDKSAKTPAAEEPAPQPDTGASFFELEPKKKVETPLAIDMGPDKFFGMWATPKDENPPDLSGMSLESKKEGVVKAKPSGKASRFTSFFAPQEEPVRQSSAPAAPVSVPVSATGGLVALFGAPPSSQGPNDQEAFQQLLAKLKSQPPASSTPPVNEFQQRKPPAVENLQNSSGAPEAFQQYRQDRPEESRPATRSVTLPAQQDYLVQRQMNGSQTTMRQDQMLQELLAQRSNSASQGSARPNQLQSGKNTEFLMNLMQSAEAAPHPMRSEQVLLGIQGNGGMERQLQQQQQQQQQRLMEQEQHARRENMIREQTLLREQALIREQAQQASLRERSASQRQIQTQPPPGFYEDPAMFQRGPVQHERQVQPPQPTVILRRPAERPTQNPPGLEMSWDRNPQIQAHLHQQHRLSQGPPPGLVGGRGMPMPHYPSGFAMNEFPPPNMMNGPTGPSGPPRNMPPPGFFNNGGPPPGFLPQGMPGFQDMPFGPPFDGRGPPSQGAYRRQ